MIPQSAHPIVRPRVLVHGSQESVLLEELVRRRSAAGAQTPIVLIGRSGKTTAYEYIARTLGGEVGLILITEDQTREIPGRGEAVRIYDGANALKELAQADAGLPQLRKVGVALAGWTQDDLIEYLLQIGSDACKSVMSRVKRDPHGPQLHGSAFLWSTALDRMVADDSVQTVRDALESFVAEHLWPDGSGPKPAHYRIAYETLSSEATERPDNRLHPAWSLLQNHMLAKFVVARQMADRLETGNVDGAIVPQPARARLAEMLSDKFIAALASRVERRVSELEQPMLVEILLRRVPHWKPRRKTRLNLSEADISRASWVGLDLRKCHFRKTQFSHSDLSGSRIGNVNRSKAIGSQFTGVNMRKARVQYSDLDESCFDKAILRRCEFYDTSLIDTSFRGADLTAAKFTSCDLAGADFEDADFTRAILWGNKITETSFRNARLVEAQLSRSILYIADFEGAVFNDADLNYSNMEGMGWDAAQFSGAQLAGVLLTGASFPNACFAGANLSLARMAEINLEGADLRGANLAHVTFHMGSSRSGLVQSTIASEGTRTGFYTDEYNEQHYKSPEVIRKANLRGADLRNAIVKGTDFYLVDLRDSKYTDSQRDHFIRSGAIL